LLSLLGLALCGLLLLLLLLMLGLGLHHARVLHVLGVLSLVRADTV
jgi:hypothetical protein